jgi:phi13 family phage major tail protein
VSAYTAGTSITYSAGSVVSEARSASISWERSDGEFYGDDVLLDTDNGVTGYTIEFEPAGLTDTIRKTLLGETQASSEYSITDAPAPYVGFGYIRVMRELSSGSPITTYEGWWYYRVQFSVTSEETRTKEKNLEWRTPTLSGKGTGVQLTSGSSAMTFAVHETFSSFSGAQTWLKSKAGIT